MVRASHRNGDQIVSNEIARCDEEALRHLDRLRQEADAQADPQPAGGEGVDGREVVRTR